MKILHINSYYSDSKFYTNLYNIQNRKYDLTIVVPVSTHHNHISHLLDKRTIVKECYRPIERIIFPLKERKIIKAYNSILDMNNIDIIHAHSLFSNGYIAYHYHLLYGIPYIVAVRSTDIDVFFKYRVFLRNIGLKILNNASKIVFISNSCKNKLFNQYIPEKFKAFLMAKSYVIPNGVNDEWFNHVKQKDNLPYKGNINIACVGKVNRNKNQLFLVNVCQRLNRLGYGITLSIVGPIQNKFIAHIIQRKSNVKLLSPMTKYELMNFYSTQHIMALASIHETFGIVYAEAMTQGLPVIYTKDQGFDNFFRDGTVGYSVKPRDSKQMKVCIDKILENYLKISNTCIDLSKEKFCWNLISNQYDELYKEVVQ